jgi:steroid delta-isomerase-like uncharacterized protein
LSAALIGTAAIGILVAVVSVGHASDAENNKALFKTFVDEVMNNGNMAKVDELMAADFVEHEEMPPGTPPGREGCKAFFVMFRKAFPDTKVTIDDLMAEGDKVMALETWTGTNKGSFMGMPATGRTVSFQCVDVVRMENGKAVEHWGVADRMGMMQQLHPQMDKMGWKKSKDKD